MIVRPTSSYQIELPDDISSQIDDRVSSFWINHQPLLLQLSSFQRADGTPLSAESRLVGRIEKTPSKWKHLTLDLVHDSTVDQAFAEQCDGNGNMVWLHSYFVWPHLTVYATVSGPEQEVHDSESWAINALRSLSVVVQ